MNSPFTLNKFLRKRLVKTYIRIKCAKRKINMICFFIEYNWREELFSKVHLNKIFLKY